MDVSTLFWLMGCLVIGWLGGHGSGQYACLRNIRRRVSPQVWVVLMAELETEDTHVH